MKAQPTLFELPPVQDTEQDAVIVAWVLYYDHDGVTYYYRQQTTGRGYYDDWFEDGHKRKKPRRFKRRSEALQRADSLNSRRNSKARKLGVIVEVKEIRL